MSAKHWIIVANNSGAKIFTLGPAASRRNDSPALQDNAGKLPPSELVEEENLEHPAGRMKAQTFDADRPGRSFQSSGMKRHGMTREVDAKTQETMTFARQVAERLENARRQGEVERMILVAAPQFLGLLRQTFSTDLRRIVDQEFSLDLLQMTPQEIRAHLPEAPFGASAKS